MLDITLDATVRSPMTAIDRIRYDGERLSRTMGQRLFCAARRAGGEDGVALAHAFRDMVCDPDVAPEHWPLTDLIALLHAAGPLRDRQVATLIGALRRLVDRIDAALDAADF